jgi:hypothetical protein
MVKTTSAEVSIYPTDISVKRFARKFEALYEVVETTHCFSPGCSIKSTTSRFVGFLDRDLCGQSSGDKS